jgi:thymidylate synthase
MSEYDYLITLKDILNTGQERDDRTGTGVISSFGQRMEFDLTQGFPLLTTKQVNLKHVFNELIWFLSGSTYLKDLPKESRFMWEPWASEDGQLGPIYGQQWRAILDDSCGRDWSRSLDQIQGLIDSLKNNPKDRGHIVSSWNVIYLDMMALRPCHCLFQMYVTNNGQLECQLYQRSADMFIGVPYNIASYALLTHMIAKMTGYTPGRLIWVGGDCHIYKNHIDQVKLQLTREVRPAPRLTLLRKPSQIENFKWEDLELADYDPHPFIKAEVSV